MVRSVGSGSKSSLTRRLPREVLRYKILPRTFIGAKTRTLLVQRGEKELSVSLTPKTPPFKSVSAGFFVEPVPADGKRSVSFWGVLILSDYLQKDGESKKDRKPVFDFHA